MRGGGVGGARMAVIAAVASGVLLIFAAAAQAAPSNDDFGNAQTLGPSLPVSASGTNVAATKQAEEPDHAGDPGGHSVWYSWTPSSSGTVSLQVTSCFSTLEAPLVAVYTGSALGALSSVAAKVIPHATNCFFSEPEQLEFSVSAGTTYRIAIDGRNGQEGAFSLNLAGPPANDDFAAAETIPPAAPETVHGTTRLATKQAGEPEHAGDPGGHSVWFSWTAPSNMPVVLTACGEFSPLDSLLAVYTGSSLNSLTPVAANDDAPPGALSSYCETSSEVQFEAVSGTTYEIAVDGADETAGRFRMQLESRPANDDFEHPQSLPSTLPASRQATNVLATKQAGEPEHAGNPGGHSVWYSWTPSVSGTVSFRVCGREEFEPLIGVYTGHEVQALTQVAAGAGAGECSFSSRAVFGAVAGTEYRIAVDGRDGAQGSFDLELNGPAANDDFANAQTLSPALPSGVGGSNSLATKEPGEPDHAGDPGGHSVWYSWTAESSGPAAVGICAYLEREAEAPGLLAVYTGTAVDSLTPVAANAGPIGSCGGPTEAEVGFEATAGTTYRIAVDGEGGREFGFGLQVTGRPGNDEFSNPDVLSPEPMTAGGTTRWATKQAGEPDHAGQPGGHSVWFSWTPSSSGPVEITACGHSVGLDPLLAVYTGTAVDSLTQVAANDDTATKPSNELCEWNSRDSEVVFDAQAGTTYRIAVDSKASVGRFGLAFMRDPANDDFAASQVLEDPLPIFASAVTKLAGKQAGEPEHAGDPGGHSVWYSWTPSVSGPVAIRVCAYYGALEPLLAVYTGSELSSLTQIAANAGGSASGCHTAHSAAAKMNVTAGTTYRIAVDGKGGSWGGFQLILEGPAANDEFNRPQPLAASLPVIYDFGSNDFATKQAGEPEHAGAPGGASVWFKWSPPRTGPVSIDTCGSAFDTLLAVYRGTAVNALTQVAANDDASGKCGPQSRLVFAAEADTVYRIAVDGKGGAQGPLELHVEGVPKNDDFSKAEKIPGSAGWHWPGSTMLATRQAGEPSHGGQPSGHSVWYSWTPTASGTVEIDACTSTFDPVLGLYTGSAVEALTPVATSDAGAGECEAGRSIRFQAVAGTTYRIAVDGAGGEEGQFELDLRSAAVASHTLTVVTAGAGTGTVSSNPAGIDCGSICAHDFEDGAMVTLTAAPSPGSYFAGWSGGGCAGTGSCELTMSAAASVSATFQPQAPGGSGGGPGATTAPIPAPKPLSCRRGFVRKLVHGKARCVKKKSKRKKRKHRS